MAKESLIVRQWANETVEELDHRVREITKSVLRSVIFLSPVLSGRFRGNWQVSVGFPVDGPIERLEGGARGSLEEVRCDASQDRKIEYSARRASAMLRRWESAHEARDRGIRA